MFHFERKKKYSGNDWSIGLYGGPEPSIEKIERYLSQVALGTKPFPSSKKRAVKKRQPGKNLQKRKQLEYKQAEGLSVRVCQVYGLAPVLE
tara:strand:- start:51 stop:323 length:273 start_codon:yes stop_codon:yes gene_type:complete